MHTKTGLSSFKNSASEFVFYLIGNCTKLVRVRKALNLFTDYGGNAGGLSPLFYLIGNCTKLVRVRKALNLFTDYGGDEGGLSPLWYY